MFTDSAKNPVWPRCYFGSRDTWRDWLSLLSTKVITITFISLWIPSSDDHVQILSKLADDGDVDSALYQSKSNVLQELILCLRSYKSTCLQPGNAWDLSIKQFPGTPFSYTSIPIHHQTVSGKTRMIFFISEIFLFQIYPSVQGQIFGRSSISFDGCDRQSYNKLMAVICRFDRLFSPNSFITIFTFRLFQKKKKKETSTKIWPISDQNMIYLHIDPKVSTWFLFYWVKIDIFAGENITWT